MSKYIYHVQGLDRAFDTKAEAFKQARNLGRAVRWACERLRQPKPEGIRVTQHIRKEKPCPQTNARNY